MSLEMVPVAYQVPAAILLLTGGLLSCFFGYRLFRVVLGVYGFVLGALIASSIMAPSEPMPLVVAALGGGVAGALILVAGYFVGVALVGAAAGALLVHLIWTRLAGEPHVLAVIVVSVMGAFVAIAVQRYVIVGGTAFAGAWTALWGGLTLADGAPVAAAETARTVWVAFPLQPAPGQPWFYAGWVALGVFGAIVQLTVGARRTRGK